MKKMITGLIIIILILAGAFIYWEKAGKYQTFKYIAYSPSTSKQMKNATIIAVGGSSALGWDDVKGGGGYLVCAFQTINHDEGVSYRFTNKSIEGDGPVQFETLFPGLLSNYQPSLVVFSYGMLDDASKKTNLKTFKQALYTEVKETLSSGAAVLIVTPPTVLATDPMGTNVSKYLEAQKEVVDEFHNKNIYFIDLNTEMTQYIASQHQSINTYDKDSWHPNELGHTLAGQILSKDYEKIFF